MALICLLLDSTNQHHGRSYTCSARDTIDQRQTTFPSIRFMQKYSRSYEDDFQMKILWYKLESANDWRFCASSLGIECCQNQIILKIFSHQNMSFHIIFNYFPNAIFGGTLFLLSCCIVEDPENASADTFYSDSLHVWSRNHSTTRHYCPTNQDTFLKQGISVLKALLTWQTFCQCYDSFPVYLNTIRLCA